MDPPKISNFEWFSKFQNFMSDRIAWPYSFESDAIFRWRARLLFTMLFLGVILGFVTLIPAGTLILKKNVWGLAIVHICGLLLGITLLAVHRIRFEIRAAIASLTFYIIGMAIIISLGPLSGGPIWLFAFAVFTGALLGNRAAFFAILLNMVSLITLSIWISTGKFGNTFPVFNTPQAMVTAGASFFILNTITAISVSALLKGLNESERRYRLIAENVADVIWTMDMNLRYTYISPSIYQQRGFTVKEGLAQSLEEVLLPSSLEKAFNLFAEKVKLIEQDDPEGWEPTVFEVEQYRKDGTVIWTSNNAKLIPGPDGKPQSILGVMIDITDRKKSEKKLRQNEEKYRIAFKTSPYVITLTSIEDGTYVEVNDAFIKLLGYSQKEIIGKSSLKYNIWKDSKDRDFLVAGLKQNGIVENLEADFKGKYGQIINGIMSARTLEIEDKHYLLSVTQDITELKENEKKRLDLETRLQQAQKMESIGTLAGGIAHDFNNILFPIMGYTEMLLEDISEDSPFRDSLNKIYTGALRAKDLVKQILTFSRHENSELKLIKMQTVIGDALKLIRSTIPANIDIKQDLQAGCGAVKADPTQIHQVIMNLTTNAYHSMQGSSGELNISLKEIEITAPELINSDLKSGFYALLSVVDKGVGMDNALILKIFDPFFTTKEKGKGTGMGLSVVHGIVKSMKGAIQVMSEPGKGTTFQVYLPVDKTFFVENKTNADKLIQGGTEKILFIDDEQGILAMGEQMLMRLGYQVTSCASSTQALEVFRSDPAGFDLVITDMAMPNMTGDKLSGEIRQIRPDIPILLCTGFSETLSEEKAELLGIKGFLMKPVVMTDLDYKIREILGK